MTYNAIEGAAAIGPDPEKKGNPYDDIDERDFGKIPPPPYTERDEIGHVAGVGLLVYNENDNETSLGATGFINEV